jgi:hypothetical protein
MKKLIVSGEWNNILATACEYPKVWLVGEKEFLPAPYRKTTEENRLDTDIGDVFLPTDAKTI